ncbi:hypothetical protein B5S30_g5637 [[Candida] boidinii]|nr:hypothetical protein B5S30_g5637 [[Candida] boidinii]
MTNIGNPNEDNLVPAEEGSDGEEIERTTNHGESEPSALPPLSNGEETEYREAPPAPVQSLSENNDNVSTDRRSNNNEARVDTLIPKDGSKKNDSPSESDGKDQNANNETSATNQDGPPPRVQSQSNIDNNVSTDKRSNNNETRDNTSIQEGDSKNNNTPSECDGKDQNANNKTSATNPEVPPPSAQPQLNSDENVDGELPPPDNRNIFIRAEICS